LPATRLRLEILEKGIMRILVRAENKRWLSTCSQTRFSRKHGSSIGAIRTPCTPRLPHHRADSIGKFLAVCRECEEERFLAVLRRVCMASAVRSQSGSHGGGLWGRQRNEFIAVLLAALLSWL
jgi:hypothetical protein